LRQSRGAPQFQAEGRAALFSIAAMAQRARLGSIPAFEALRGQVWEAHAKRNGAILSSSSKDASMICLEGKCKKGTIR
jgi:hypothetical protein